MLTDAPPRDRHRVGFDQSDRMKVLDLPDSDVLPTVAKSIEAAMQTGKTAPLGVTVRRTLADRLAAHEAGRMSAGRFRDTGAAASGVQADLEKVRFILLSLWKLARV